MKFRHVVHFTQSCYLTVACDVYQMFHAQHFSFITKTDSSLAMILPPFAWSKLSSEVCMIWISH